MESYANYHKHDHGSNIFVPDSKVTCEDYLKRIKELGYNHYWTTNHGWGGDIFEARDLCDKYDIKCHFGLEGYIVPDPLEKDNRNYHMIILPKTDMARKKVNLITSHASEKGFYYKPRIFLSDLLSLDKDDVYITTACVMGLLRDEDSRDLILEPLLKHFGDNILFEVQNHNDDFQRKINNLALSYAEKYGNLIVAANDSHYIYTNDPENHLDQNGRLEFLKGKGINYGDEDTYILDYPDYDTFFERFKKQGVLTDDQIYEAINNTKLFEECEEIKLDKNIKMPSAYPSLTPDEKIVELKHHINERFRQIAKDENITGDKLKEYIDGIKYEMKIIEDTNEINTADYFLLNEKIVDEAVNKYHGVLTRTGRGSCGSYYINRILGMTQIDRFTSPVKLYPERFMSTARLLENRSMPDIDFNVASQEPFIKAARDILGEHCVYPMVAYGTMQEGEAFRNVCRSHEIPFDEFNDVAKNIESYANNPKWAPLVKEANAYVGVIVSASVHPCAFAMDNIDLRKEYGVVKIGESLCVMVTSGEADYWKILKDDFLIVSVWGIISDTFKLIGKPILTVNQLLQSIDDKVWQIYADGITCTLNQVDSDYATSLMKRYKAHSVRDMAQFTAAVRPSFDAWRDDFLARKPYTTGSKYLDEVLSETEGRVTFQETLMTYFQWLGVTPAESIGLIKKISKKKIKPEDFAKLEERLKENWIAKTGSIEAFDTTWEMVQGCMAYGFAAPHALATAIDSLYGAWLKVNYPLEYYTTVFGYYKDDLDRTNKLTEELSYFGITLNGIKFRHSRAQYSMDVNTKSIYKGLESIKYLNADVAERLYDMKDQHFNSFIDILNVFPGNSKQLEILIRLGFFSEFGKSLTLLKTVELYEKLYGRKNIKKLGSWLSEDVLRKYATSETDKMFKFNAEDNFKMLSDLSKLIPDQELPISSKLDAEAEYLGYVDYKEPKAKSWGIILDIDTKYASPKVSVYNLCDGSTWAIKMNKTAFAKYPICKGELIQYTYTEKPSVKMDENGHWVQDPNKPPVKWFNIVTSRSEEQYQKFLENH